MKKNKRREDIRKSLLAQLAARGAAQAHFEDMVEDYMKLWDVKERQVEDIEKRGIFFLDQSSRGFESQKNNPSVKELHGTNRQMLSILKELGLTTDKAADPNVDI